MNFNLKHLFCLFCYKVRLFVNAVLGLFGARKDCYGDNMQSGELIVVGKQNITIELKNFPSFVKVEFKDHCVVVPCNSQNYDELSYSIEKHPSKDIFILNISWHVSGVRDIEWVVYS